jgi:hypothetical protein
LFFKPVVRYATVGLATAALAVAAAEIPAAARTADVVTPAKAIACSTSSSGKAASFYSGLSASYAYDKRFSGTNANIPGLNSRTPQGVAAWSNWDGKGHNLLLVTAYRTGSNAYVYGLDASSGALVNTVEIADTHAGGVTVIGNWIFISGAGQSIRKYRTADMRAAMNHPGGHLYVKRSVRRAPSTAPRFCRTTAGACMRACSTTPSESACTPTRSRATVS